jgi:molecular chaperone GrpE
MSDHSSKLKTNADDAIRAALESVERLEKNSADAAKQSAASGNGTSTPVEADEIELDNLEVMQAGDMPPSASTASPASGEDDLLLIDDDEVPEEAPPALTSQSNAGQNAMLSAMIAAKNEAVEALSQTQQEAKSLRERLLRVSAESENAKKRQSREKQESIRFANENLLKELLPVLDNMERAVSGAQNTKDAGEDASHLLDNLVEGVSLVYKQFNETLNRCGVEGFSALGKPFDPAFHEAVAQREDKSIPHQSVLEEYQKGYILNGRLVRPAMVIVGTGGPKPVPVSNEDQSVQQDGAAEQPSKPQAIDPSGAADEAAADFSAD